MSSTYQQLHYHIVFGTKYREFVITADWRNEMHKYLGGIINGLGGHPIKINGMADHVHILAGLRASISISESLLEIKKYSSKWARTVQRKPNFTWQKGYSAFTVSKHDLPRVMRYIENQEQHHRDKSYQEELLMLLKEGGWAWPKVSVATLPQPGVLLKSAGSPPVEEPRLYRETTPAILLGPA